MTQPSRLVLAAAACAAAAAAWWTQRPVEAPAPPVERVLAAARPMSAEPGLQLAPRFSPDARLVAFALAEGEDSRIVVQATDGSSRRFIGAEQGVRVSPVFFPGGKRIAFWQAAPEGCGIFERDLDSGAEKPLLDCAMLPRVRFDISPDGRALVFTGSPNPDMRAGLWILPLDGGKPRALTRPPEGAGDDLHPRFSADGRTVAFFRGPEGLRQPWIVAADEPSRARAAGRECGRCYGLAWMGEELLVAGDWYGQPGLRAVDMRAGKSREVGGEGARFPDVSARGDVVYERARNGQSGAPPSRSRIEAAANAVRPDEGIAQIDLVIARR
jgi:Tol biopolymer transport system component